MAATPPPANRPQQVARPRRPRRRQPGRPQWWGRLGVMPLTLPLIAAVGTRASAEGDGSGQVSGSLTDFAPDVDVQGNLHDSGDDDVSTVDVTPPLEQT